MVFEQLCAKFRDHGKEYVRGDFITTDSDLEARFPGKFVLIDDGSDDFESSSSPFNPTGDSPKGKSPDGTSRKRRVKKTTKKKKAAAAKSKKEKAAVAEDEVDGNGWDDLTSEFSELVGENTAVLYDGNAYKVVDVEARRVINEDELKKSMINAINDMLNKDNEVGE